jgi:hypothetical protein
MVANYFGDGPRCCVAKQMLVEFFVSHFFGVPFPRDCTITHTKLGWIKTFGGKPRISYESFFFITYFLLTNPTSLCRNAYTRLPIIDATIT